MVTAINSSSNIEKRYWQNNSQNANFTLYCRRFTLASWVLLISIFISDTLEYLPGMLLLRPTSLWRKHDFPTCHSGKKAKSKLSRNGCSFICFSFSSSFSSSMAFFAISSTFPTLLRKPEKPSSFTSGIPPVFDEITGTPAAIASNAAKPKLSVWDGNKNKSLKHNILSYKS